MHKSPPVIATDETGLHPASTTSPDNSGCDPASKRPARRAEPSCNFEINVEAHGDVNIHHHCSPDAPAPCPSPPATDSCYPPVAPGNTCLPPVAGRKHKRSPAQKLQALAQRARVPSVLAASTLQLVRRHLAGKPAANALERAAFARLAGLPAAVRSTLACAVNRLDTLLDLAERTGADFPLPDATSFTTEGDIKVKVTPLEKIPTQYRERREYRSDDEDSRYEIVFRFNRSA